MSDYGLLETIRRVLRMDTEIQRMGLGESIYYSLPPKPKYPLVLLELDKIHAPPSKSKNEATARIEFRINIMSYAHLGRKCFEIASIIDEAVDGVAMQLSDHHLANFRKKSSVIDMPMARSPRSVQHYYQAIVWHKRLDDVQA